MHSAHTSIRMIQYLSCVIPPDHGVDLAKFSGSGEPFAVNDQRFVGSLFFGRLFYHPCESGRRASIRVEAYLLSHACARDQYVSRVQTPCVAVIVPVGELVDPWVAHILSNIAGQDHHRPTGRTEVRTET